MKASLVMPWFDMGCPIRRRSLAFVLAYWQAHLPEVEVVVESGPRPYGRARALNAAVRRARGDVLFEVGPDGIVPPSSVRAALEQAAQEDGLFICHNEYLHLSPGATDRLLAEGVDADLASYTADDCEDYGTTSVDVACFSRATWEQAGGYDERFGIWGGDDVAFAIASTLAGPGGRLAGRWVHLWHPRRPESDPSHREYLKSFVKLSEYVEASNDPDALRVLIESRA